MVRGRDDTILARGTAPLDFFFLSFRRPSNSNKRSSICFIFMLNNWVVTNVTTKARTKATINNMFTLSLNPQTPRYGRRIRCVMVVGGVGSMTRCSVENGSNLTKLSR